MRKFLIFVLIMIFLGAGLYFGKRYYNDEYLPKKTQEENIERQEKLYDSIKPDIPPKDDESAASSETAAISETSGAFPPSSEKK